MSVSNFQKRVLEKSTRRATSLPDVNFVFPFVKNLE